MNRHRNPYWDAVRRDAAPDNSWLALLSSGRRTDAPLVLGWQSLADRRDLAARFCWTVTDPATVRFVAKWCAPAAVDPMAGTGYWAWQLRQRGVDVAAYDVLPGAKNEYHSGSRAFVDVAQADCADAARRHADRTLLLSWPPYMGLKKTGTRDPGAAAIKAYAGSRIVYVGEGDGGCCGGERMWALLGNEARWRETARHRPVQWVGIHDLVTVYERVRRDREG